MDAKKVGLIVATAMPPPGKLRRAMGKDEGDGEGDEMETGPEMGDESEGENEGAMAMGDMWDALKRGDKAGAYDAFCDLIDMHKSRSAEEPSEG